MRADPTFTVSLDDVASCFEGIVPSTVCSCSADGVPNAVYLSVVHRIGERHVALSLQFFNKTTQNILRNPLVQVLVISPETADQYRLDLEYERTETKGSDFERMRTRLDAVASQMGMSKVFRLRGLDIYRVLDCRPVAGIVRSSPTRRTGELSHLDAFTERLAACDDLERLMEAGLEQLSETFGYKHAFVMVPDEDGQRLFTIASLGYEPSGVGSEVVIGEGILGFVAQQRTPIRITSMPRELVYSRAVRAGVSGHMGSGAPQLEIPLPGLDELRSQLAVPLIALNEFLGVLCLQSESPGRFLDADERLMQIAARHMAATMSMMRLAAPAPAESAPPAFPVTSAATGRAVIKRYRFDDSVFIDDSYLIKGVPGRIFWKLLQIHTDEGRSDFTNREIRLDASLRLPDIKDNLETRLILLRRRLQEHCTFISLSRTGRGKFQLEIHRHILLEEHP